MFQIQSFTCEGLRDHLVTDCAAPTFAYFVSSDRAGASIQSAELTVNGWTIRNPDQCGTRYAGQPLKPFTTYTATLTVTSDSGETDTARLTFETGRMDTPWQGKWITDGAYVFKEKKVSPVPMVFRKALPLRGEIAQAKLYATAMGIYELNIDGQKVGERYFAPGFTSYAHQLMYQTYDVTDMLHSGSCITATVAGGWAVGSFVFTRVNRVTADRQALLAELRITYRDGRTEVIGTDESWQVTEDGPVRMADFYDGETYDATVSLDKANWRSAVQERLRVKPKLMADYGADVKEHEKFAPVSCKKLGNALIYDFGQNFAGVVRLTVTGKRGQKITIRHSEVLNPDGTLNTAFLRTAKATATYICKEGRQTWSPRLTYMGFRYISVEGVREEDVQVTGVMLYSDIQQTGSFRCSNEMLNRLQENIVRSAKSNFMDIPTDCPQRDERMGWTGDINVFAQTALDNFGMDRFLEKWLLDVKAEQRRGGGIPNTVPVQGYGFPATMPVMAVDFWGDACVTVPWALYRASGDKDILRTMYPTMKRYVKACRFWASFGLGKKRYIWHTPAVLHFGDWIAPGLPKMSDWQKRSRWTATASLYYTNKLLSRIAEAIGETEDVKKYSDYADKVADAYMSVFTDGKGKLLEEFQTAYVLPLYFGMFPEEQRKAAADNLAALAEKNGWRIATGFPGTPYILFALADNGRADAAYNMLMCDDCPSWLYEVKAGATTIWERWDAISPEGGNTGANDGTGGMVSFNHYASGAVGDFFYRRIAGIEPLEAGYKRFAIRPVPGGGLTHAEAVLNTPYGEIGSRWETDGGKFSLTVRVPVSTECEITLPSGRTERVGSGEYTLTENI